MVKDNAYNDLLSSSLEGDELIKKIQETNAPGLDEDDMKPLYQIVEDIMTQASPLSAKITNLGATSHDDEVKSDDKAVAEIAKMLESPINYTSYVMTWKCVGEVDSHAVTMQILESLSNYWWAAKAVIAYAAFAINYGEFSLLTQSSDKTIATLMGFSDQFSRSDHSEAVLDLLATALKLTRCMVDFRDIPPKYITLQPHVIPLAIYWIIRTLVVCASFLTDVLSDHVTTAEGIKMFSTLLHKLSPLLQNCQDQVANFRNLPKIEGKYIEFQNTIGTPSPQNDNMKVLSAFFRPREDQTPIYHGSTKKSKRLEVLKHKHVLLLISDPELPREELNVIHGINNNLSTRECEILWLPIVDPNIPMNATQEGIFRQLRDSFPWFSAEHPSVIEPAAIKFIQEDLNFVHLPLVAVLDAQGKLVSRDALPMMYIWGIRAFPFTSTEESKLWGEESAWNIELLADHIDPRLPAWINENKVICLYGGDDIDWIRKFTQAARTAAEALHVPLEMFYVGRGPRLPRSNLKEEVRVCHEAIIKDNLSHTFNSNYYDFVWFFWTRLFSMWDSKKKLGLTEGDKVMLGIIQLLSCESSDEGGCWAAFSRGNNEMHVVQGYNLLPALEDYATWAKEVDQPDKFVEVLYRNLFRPPSHHCSRRLLPGAATIPDVVYCAECGKPMKKCIMYRCCEDE